MPANTFIIVDNQTQTARLIERMRKGDYPDFRYLKEKPIAIFSSTVLEAFIEEEERHDRKILTQGKRQSLRSMSSGERKKALLAFLLQSEPEVIVAVNPFDAMDQSAQEQLKQTLRHLSKTVLLIQIGSRISDLLPGTELYYSYLSDGLKRYDSEQEFLAAHSESVSSTLLTIPQPLQQHVQQMDNLVRFEEVSVSFDGRPVLNKIDWSIHRGEFWQLKGPNGSGKSTLLQMITGDSHKGYGQDLTIFGIKKGSGESVWQLKEKIGYFTPAMIDRFKGYHTLEDMLISGIHDAVGLYTTPTDTEKRVAMEWLQLLGLHEKRSAYFNTLSEGQTRIVMVARAMIKHPALLILDEPTVGLDDSSAAFFVHLVNQYASQSSSALVFVSHRNEPGLTPDYTYELRMTEGGAIGSRIHP